MDKEKEIQEMAKTHYDCIFLNRECESCKHYKCVAYEVCEEMYNAGYRKQSITAKEIIQEILDNSRPTFDKDGKPIIEINADLTANLCKKYGANNG